APARPGFRALIPLVNDLAQLSLLVRFTSVVEGLMNDVQADVVWGWNSIPLIKLIWRRLRRMKHRFAAIVARFEAGTLPPPRTPRQPPEPGRPAAKPRQPPPLELILRFGWICPIIDRAFVRSWDLEEILE